MIYVSEELEGRQDKYLQDFYWWQMAEEKGQHDNRK